MSDYFEGKKNFHRNFFAMQIRVKDQLGNEIFVDKKPSKIVSLVPSQTEFLHALGLENEVVGITKFCVHPNSWFRSKTRIGGTKTVVVEQVRQLQPDIIFANKEENVKEQIDDLRQICPVYVSDISTLQHALQMMADVGKLTGKEKEATAICDKITASFKLLEPAQTIKTAYLIWNDPYMTVGGDTFISDMMNRCGFENMFQDQTRYPTVTLEYLNEMNCELLLLSSEPFPFQQKHVDAIRPLLSKTKIILADGEMFSWYGSNLLKAVDYFRQLMATINL